MNDPKMVAEITKLAAETAVTATMDFLKSQQKEQHDRRVRNTKLLLKHYRKFVLHVEGYSTGAQLSRDEVIGELEENEFAIESIKRSKERTFIMVKFIEQMMDVYRMICERSDKPENVRRYKIIYDLYVSDDEKSIQEIADCHKIENRTIYRDINEGSKALSVLLFGVDGIKMIK